VANLALVFATRGGEPKGVTLAPEAQYPRANAFGSPSLFPCVLADFLIQWLNHLSKRVLVARSA
jgi:hypothetical protein